MNGPPPAGPGGQYPPQGWQGGPPPGWQGGPPPGRAPRPPRPPLPHELRLAVYLWLASLVVGVIGVVVSFGTARTALREEVDAQLSGNPDLATVDPDLVVVIAVVLQSVVWVALVLFLLWRLAVGSAWARVVLTVVAVLNVVSTAVSVSGAEPLDALLQVVNALLVACAVVCTYSEGAKQFLAPTRGR
ncbi:hypothetical protein [Rhodococcus sp. X156]|uniref:hypothetical protein n=1 Tax=Rhodococcus sp. X156 TaxID=2499145 RepID=UPI000FDB667B|nr:hypothetical protein [Rhodococcus sp. X156]